MTKRLLLMGMLVLAIGLMVGCGGSAVTATVPADDVPVVAQEAEDTVVAEAVIEPARWSELRFETTGDVVAVLVQEGDFVAAGALLGRLDTEILELALEEAQAAQETAELSLVRAETEHEHQLAGAELALQTTEDRLAQARVRFPDLTAAEVALQQAIRAEADAAYEYEKAENRPWEWRYEDVQKAYTDAWQNAKDNLAVAQAEYDAARAERYASSQELAILETEVQRVHLELEWLQEGIDPLLAQEVGSARLRVAQVQAELEAVTLVAPFDGVVTTVNVEPGDAVMPGAVVLVLATLDQLQARTTDLTELDVARVAEGQSATVTVDALPEQKFAGVVREVALQPGDYRGDVVYAVTVELTGVANAPLRWGMTALVKIETR
jgi:HlyD family secretion protein